MVSPLHAGGHRKGQGVLAAPTVLCCILLAGSHTIASTHHSEHLPLHLFDSFVVRARDVKENKLHFALIWCNDNIQT